MVSSELLTRYPFQDELLPQLARQTGLPEEMLLLTAGSDAAIKALFQAYVSPGDRVLMLDPSYAMYPIYARMFEALPIQIGFNLDLSLDEQALMDAAGSGVRLVVLANPNQPTGTILKPDTVLGVLDRAIRAGALVAVDEAYYPFSDVTNLPSVREHPHLLILRTFSKACGLAGLRIGWVAAASEITESLFKVRSAHDVNSMAMLCARLILDHPEIVEAYKNEVHSAARLLAKRLTEMGLIPLPTSTNFMLIRVAHLVSPKQLVLRLKEQGYLVKGPFDSACISGCIRVTLGPPGLMIEFAECLQHLLCELEAS